MVAFNHLSWPFDYYIISDAHAVRARDNGKDNNNKYIRSGSSNNHNNIIDPNIGN